MKPMLITEEYYDWFTDQSMSRARQYARANRVTFHRNTNDTYFYVVAGNAGTQYQVTVTTGDYDGDIEATCTCPYNWGGYCKHIGAVILTGLKNGEFELTDDTDGEYLPEAEPSTPADMQHELEDMVFDLSRPPKLLPEDKTTVATAGKYRDDPLLDTTDSYAQPVSEEASAEYLLIFAIVDSNTANINAATHDPYQICPMLQYVRLDGTPGRIHSFRHDATCAPLSDAERYLLSWMFDTEAKQIPLSIALPHLVTHPSIRTVVKTGKHHQPVTFMEMRQVHVTFFFAGLQNQNTPVFRPRLQIETVESSTEDDRQHDGLTCQEIDFGESGMGIYIVERSKGIIYYVNNHALGHRKLARMLRADRTYSLEDIRATSSTMSDSFLTISEPTGKIHVKVTEPKLALYLEPAGDKTFAHPAFHYDRRSIHPDLNAELLLGGTEGDTLVVHRRTIVHEAQLMLWLYQAYEHVIESEEPLVFAGDTNEFIFSYGEKFLEHDVKLYLKDGGKPIKRADSFEIIASSGIDWLDLKLTVDGHTVSPEDIDLLRGTVEVETEYLLLDPTTLEKLRALYASGTARKDRMLLSPSDLATISSIDSLVDAGDDAGYRRIQTALSRLAAGFETKRLRRPRGLVGTLRPYQKSGLKWLEFLADFGFGGILADDMGLGKTIQAIALVAYLQEQGEEGPFLVVAPVSTISNWLREIARFVPGLDAYAHVGPDRPKEPEKIRAYRGVIVTSYHTLQRDIDNFEDVTWSQVILDESQALKNPKAKNHKTVSRLNFDRILAMSGTPVENNIQELWSVMSILNPGLLGSKTDFLKKYRKQISAGDTDAIELLRQKIRPFLLRRTKEEVAKDLPPKEEITVEVSLSSIESRFYFALKEKLREEVRSILMSEEPFRAANAIITALTKLRQAAIAPSLVGGPTSSSKLDAVMEKLSEAVTEGHKILVFSQYVRILSMLTDRVKAAGWEYRYLDGSIPPAKRKVIIDDFQNLPEVSMFLISLKAGGVGINLTEADYVFLVDPWWNPAVESQAIDRTHRIGQKKPVFAYRFVSENTIEERILELQETKRELVKNIIGKDTSMFKSLTSDEIIGLFE